MKSLRRFFVAQQETRKRGGQCHFLKRLDITCRYASRILSKENRRMGQGFDIFFVRKGIY